MKKNLIKVSLLSLFLMILSTVVILLMSNIYTFSFPINENTSTEISIADDSTGQVEVLEKRKEKDQYFVTVKAKKTGKVHMIINNGEYQNEVILYVHKSMTITDNTYFGKATGSEIIPISLSILLVYVLYLLIREYRHSMKENLYQYKNIAYLGIILFLSFFTCDTLLSIFRYYGLYDTVNRVISSVSFVSFILLPIAMVTFILATIMNIHLIHKEGMSLRNLLGLFFSIFLCLSTLLPNFVYNLLMKSQTINIYNLNSIGPYLYNFIEALVYLTISYLECILIGTIIIALKAVRKKVEYNKDYMIILGCKIKKDGSLTPLLKGRVDRALAFREEQLEKAKKDLIFIPSGGKGSDEIISEAEAMKNYLLEQGIKEKNILVENQSRNTFENIQLSHKLIQKEKMKVAFSTTNYHVLRAGLLATEQGLKVEGIGSKTKAYFWMNAFIREFIGTLYSEKKKHMIVLVFIIFIIIIMIGITYFANNI